MFAPPTDDAPSETTPSNAERIDSQDDELSAASTTYRKKYRSKSAVSNDPRSPYYTSQGFRGGISLEARFCKSPSVSCVPGYDGDRYAGVEREYPFNGGIPGLNLSPDDPKAATIRQHYYPEGGWGWVVCVCAVLVEIITTGLHSSFGFLIVIIQKNFGMEATIVQAVMIPDIERHPPTSLSVYFCSGVSSFGGERRTYITLGTQSLKERKEALRSCKRKQDHRYLVVLYYVFGARINSEEVNMVAPLSICTKEEQGAGIRFRRLKMYQGPKSIEGFQHNMAKVLYHGEEIELEHN